MHFVPLSPFDLTISVQFHPAIIHTQSVPKVLPPTPFQVTPTTLPHESLRYLTYVLPFPPRPCNAVPAYKNLHPRVPIKTRIIYVP